MVRLRKMGLPEFNVSSDRLKLRGNLGKALDDIFREYSFQRVSFVPSSSDDDLLLACCGHDNNNKESSSSSCTTSMATTTIVGGTKQKQKSSDTVIPTSSISSWSHSTDANKNKVGDKTKWKRSIWLYQRMGEP